MSVRCDSARPSKNKFPKMKKRNKTKKTSKDTSSGIVVAGSLTIESGTIEAAAYAEQNSEPVSGAIVVQSNGT